MAAAQVPTPWGLTHLSHWPHLRAPTDRLIWQLSSAGELFPRAAESTPGAAAGRDLTGTTHSSIPTTCSEGRRSTARPELRNERPRRSALANAAPAAVRPRRCAGRTASATTIISDEPGAARVANRVARPPKLLHLPRGQERQWGTWHLHRRSGHLVLRRAVDKGMVRAAPSTRPPSHPHSMCRPCFASSRTRSCHKPACVCVRQMCSTRARCASRSPSGSPRTPSRKWAKPSSRAASAVVRVRD